MRPMLSLLASLHSLFVTLFSTILCPLHSHRGVQQHSGGAGEVTGVDAGEGRSPTRPSQHLSGGGAFSGGGWQSHTQWASGVPLPGGLLLSQSAVP